jgi:hypothetical protein
MKDRTLTSAVSHSESLPAPRREKRLVLRVLEIWRQARIGDLAPKAGSVRPIDAGEDAPAVFVLDLFDNAPPRFSYIGEAVRPAGFPERANPLLEECPEDSVLFLVARHWREIIERGVPVTRGGEGVNNGKPVRYRGVMAPLVDEDGVISSILGAANWRVVED